MCSFNLVQCYRTVGSPLAVRPGGDLLTKVLSTGGPFVQLLVAQLHFFFLTWGWPEMSQLPEWDFSAPPCPPEQGSVSRRCVLESFWVWLLRHFSRLGEETLKRGKKKGAKTRVGTTGRGKLKAVRMCTAFPKAHGFQETCWGWLSVGLVQR